MRLAAPLVALALLGCTGWGGSRPVSAIPADPPVRDRFQVWTAGQSQVLHAVRLGKDTLSGVPYWQAPTCDSCRVAIPTTRIDSVRVRTAGGPSPASPEWVSAGAVTGVATDPPTRKRFQLWAAGQAQVLHSVRTRNDTLSGVPYWQHPECDPCRVAIPTAQVDSVRVRTGSERNTGVLLGAVALIIWALSQAPAGS